MKELYEQSRKELEEYCASNQGMVLLNSELFDLWVVATKSCRDEIKRLERLLAFHIRGRTMDADERNKVFGELQNRLVDKRNAFISELNKSLMEPK